MLAADKSCIIGMAWADRIPFDVIENQYGLNEAAVIRLMRRELKRSSFNVWRQRVSGRKSEHRALFELKANRAANPVHDLPGEVVDD